MDAFLMPLIGGGLIGFAAVIMLLLLGRITGISGILWGSFFDEGKAWRWKFLVGLMLGPLIYHSITLTPIPDQGHWLTAIVGGVLVGVGVKLGSGCTSGHGVCGIGRLSVRSIVATITFMATGILTVYVFRHIF